MQERELLQVALGLAEPWRVARTEFSAQERRLDIYLDFPRGARFPCPEGDQPTCPVHDMTPKQWRHLDFFQHQAYLHARIPRVDCPAHGVRLIEVPWARPQSGFSLLFEALAMALLAEMPVKAAAELVGEHDTRLWRVLHHYVARARSRTCYAGLATVGIDETSAARGQDYITLFCDLQLPRVVYATADRDQETVRRFAQDLAGHGGDPRDVREVCCDMSPAFIRGIGDHLPAAEITFDRYHLAQQLGQAIDQVRREEVRSRPELRGTRYMWLKRPAKLRPQQAVQLAYLSARHRGLRTARAYAWRLAFDAFFEQPPARAEPYLERWFQGAVRSRLAPIQNFAYLIDEHWQGVLRWHHSRISNGVLEAINSLVQAAKRRARGYRTKRNLIAMTYLIAGKLDLQLAHSK